MSENKTDLNELGEFGLIDKLTADTKKYRDSTMLGVGDDAAVIDVGDKYMLVSTDMLVEGIHFNMMYTPLMHLGYKAAIVNFSDIYAMNGDVTQITVSIAVSSRFTAEALEELYKGIHKACELYQVDLVGGDTTSSTSGLIISVTAIGEVNKDELVMRSGGKENELLVVTGDLGGAFMGLQMLERENEVFKANPDMQPQFEGKDYILERQLKPEARKDVIHYLKELGVKPTTMIDISDGLASEALHLCKASDLGCVLYDEKIPIDQETFDTAREFEIDPSTAALNGGEDYELLFSIKQEDYDKIKDSKHLSVVGNFMDSGSGWNIADRAGKLIPLTAQGWNHFSKD